MSEYTVHWKTELSTLRVYRKGDSYDERSDSYLSATVHHLGDTELFVCNVKGNLCRTLLRLIFKPQYDKGVRVVKYDREGVDKVIHLDRYFSR